jgi:hypothetical protein
MSVPETTKRSRRLKRMSWLALLCLALLTFATSAAARGQTAAARRHTRAAARHTGRARRAVRREHAVLRVGTFNGIPGEYTSIQEAVNAAKPGDWILIAPGDYKQSSTQPIPTEVGDGVAGADILVTTPDLFIRGMNRNTVMIDGTKPGTPECSSEESAQTFGPTEGSAWRGNNGVVVYKASGVHLQNFSTCNFLGSEHGGDSVWFDGGGSTGKQEIGSWWGEYLSSTSTYWGGKEKPSDEYGIYASNTYGPGLFNQTYANNMADSGYYIGACPSCDSTINHGHAEDNDLGYSGSNSGGRLVIENSEFKNNEEGVATQSQNNDDAPSPQEGLCPGGKENPKPPPGALRKDICWVAVHNKILDNNNGATPTSPGAPGLLGTGMTIAGGRNDLVADNKFSGNDAWGMLLLPYPGIKETPQNQGGSSEIPAEDDCRGGIGTGSGETYVCEYEPYADEVEGNTFSDNGGYKNVSNADMGEVATALPETTGSCWHDNVELGGGEPSSEPADLQTTHASCESANIGGDPITSPLGVGALCDSQLVTECPSGPGEEYKRSSEVKMAPLPQERGMRNPCHGVPANPWCDTPADVREWRKEASHR